MLAELWLFTGSFIFVCCVILFLVRAYNQRLENEGLDDEATQAWEQQLRRSPKKKSPPNFAKFERSAKKVSPKLRRCRSRYYERESRWEMPDRSLSLSWPNNLAYEWQSRCDSPKWSRNETYKMEVSEKKTHLYESWNYASEDDDEEVFKMGTMQIESDTKRPQNYRTPSECIVYNDCGGINFRS